MSNDAASATGVSDGRSDHADGAGFAMLGLAQLVTMFAIWMALWPGAFGIPAGSPLGPPLATLFTAAGAAGFLMAFRTLSLG